MNLALFDFDGTITTREMMRDFMVRAVPLRRQAWGKLLLAPCVVVAGEVLIGGREMRTMGVEAAYAVHPSTGTDAVPVVDADELAATARRVARTWRW